MPNMLTQLRIGEVSSVDRGAGEGVKIMLMKRGEPLTARQIVTATLVKGLGLIAADPTCTEPFAKYGDAMTFDEALEACEAGEFAEAMMDEIQEAYSALQNSVWSIMGDEAVADKVAALQETFDEFKAHVPKIVPEYQEDQPHVAKAIEAAGIAVALSAGSSAGTFSKGDEAVSTVTDIAKLAKDTTALTAFVKTAEENAAKLTKLAEDFETLKKASALASLSPAEQDYCKAAKMTDAEKAKFAEQDAKKRAEHIAAHPLEKLLDLPPEILAKIAKGEEALAMVKAQKSKDDEDAAEDKAKKLGLPAGFGKTIQKAATGDGAAMDLILGEYEKVVTQLKGAGMFKELGDKGGGGDATSPEAMINKRVDELIKADPKLTTAKAITKIAESRLPADRELWSAYKSVSNVPAGQKRVA